MKRIGGMFLSLIALTGCQGPSGSSGPERPEKDGAVAVSEGNSWLLSAGSGDARFDLIAKHFRGFDVAMAETGYRYGELYWAGEDRNWGYANYQLGKIRTAIANGLERRPKRAASAKMIEGPLAGMEEAIAAKDAALFAERFRTLTATCNACHQAERVPFVHVRPPPARVSPAGPLPADGGAP
ncbi:MAG: hypothetical protein AB1405_09530 [Bdellovibrionota bacterium]